MPETDKRPWKVLLELTPTTARLLVTDEQGDILGQPKLGKTWLGLDLALSVATATMSAGFT